MQWITTEDTKREIWSRIFEFANDQYTKEKLKIFHSISDQKHDQNIRKQASQIRLSILQAKDYFDQAERASLVTSPVLTYYGALSLCTATMLFRGSGDKSLDKLREDPRSRMHGLHALLTDEADIDKSVNLCKKTKIEIKDDGFFKLWFETLPKSFDIYAISTNYLGGREESNFISFVTDKTEPYGDYKKRPDSLIDSLRKIPDMVELIERIGVETGTSKISMGIYFDEGETLLNQIIQNARTLNNLEALRSKYIAKDCNSYVTVENKKIPGRLSAVITTRLKNGAEGVLLRPTYRRSINGDNYAFTDDLNVPEIVDLFKSAYAMGMLCRYYPDIWIKNLDSSSLSSKIIESAVQVIVRKLPMQALGLLLDQDITVSIHRPPWEKTSHR